MATSPGMTSVGILTEAERLIHGDRHEAYGSAGASFRRTGILWGAILGHEVSPRQVALCMAALKISREVGNHKDDNLVDAVGYLALAADVS